MSDIKAIGDILAETLEVVRVNAAAAIAGAVPADVAVSIDERGIRVAGAALSVRGMADARLRDFAALARAR